MKIALIIDRFQPRKGGAEHYLRQLAIYLKGCGDEPVLFSMDDAGESFPGKCIQVRVGAWPRGLREWFFAKRCREAVAAEKCETSFAVRHVLECDVYQPHGGAVEAAWEARLESKSTARRIFSRLFRLVDLKYCLLKSLDRRLVENSKQVLALSDHSAWEFRSLHPRQTEKIQVLPLGIDLQRFSPQGEKLDLHSLLGIPNAAKLLLFVAHDFELKGLSASLATTAELNRKGYESRLIVLGRGKNLQRWEEKISSLDLNGKVRFMGEVEDAAPFYRSADLLLHPTFYDPCSHVVLEALACGLPAITTRRNGASECGVSHLRVIENPENSESLTKAAIELLATEKIKSELPERYSWEFHCKALRELLSSYPLKKQRS